MNAARWGFWPNLLGRPSEMKVTAQPAPTIPRLLIICSLVYLPLLLIRTLYWDDWSWLWVWWVESPGMLFEYMRQVSHPGYWFPMAFFYGVGGEYAGILARTVAVVSHVAASILLCQILQRPTLTRSISIWTATIYLLSPFYYARGFLVQSVYDIFALFYLLSIWLLRSERKMASALALGTFIVSLSLETLIFLEPLRFLFVHQPGKGIRATVWRCIPFWLSAAAFIIVKQIWLRPYGNYAGYNEINFAVSSFFESLALYGDYCIAGASFTIDAALHLVPWPVLVGLGIPGLLALWFLERAGRLKSMESVGFGLTVCRILFGALLAVLGIMPYALAAREPTITQGESRLVYVSIAGVSIVLAALIAAIPQRLLRVYVFGALLTILGLSSLYVTKWYIYDALIQRDLIPQLYRAAVAAPSSLPVFELRMVPRSTQVLAMNRKMSAEDLIVPLNLLRDLNAPLIFVYDESWWSDVSKLPPDTCTITTNDRYPCSGRRMRVEYRLNPDTASVDRMSYWTLLQYLLRNADEVPSLGVLNASGEHDSSARTAVVAPQTPGGRVVAGILQLSGGSAH
jgi:hypothetical protein